MSDSPESKAPDTAPVSSSSLLGNMSESERASWRLTGEVPTAKAAEPVVAPENLTKTAESSPAQPEDQAASTDAHAPAASEPATSGKPNLKTRNAQLDAEIEDLQTKLARRNALRKEIGSDQPQDAKPAASSPVEDDPNDPEPQQADIDTKFGGDYDAYLSAKAAHAGRREARRLFEAQHAAEIARQAQLQKDAETQKQDKAWKQQVIAAKAAHADFDEVMKRPNLIPEGSQIDQWILKSEHGLEVLYQLASNPAEVDRISGLPELDQVRELVRLEMSLGPAPVKTLTSAPDPAPALGSRPAVDTDEAEAAIARGDTAAYIAIMNKRETAARKR